MKRLFLFLTVAAAVCCAACSDDPEVAESDLSLLEDNVTFDMFGGRSVLEITADSPWTVSCDDDWCRTNVAEGSHTKKIVLTVDQSFLPEERTTAVRFYAAGEEKHTVTVTQEKFEPILVLAENGADITVYGAGSEPALNLRASVAWKIEGATDWCAVSQSEGTKSSVVKLLLTDDGEGVRPRSATLTVSSEMEGVEPQQVTPFFRFFGSPLKCKKHRIPAMLFHVFISLLYRKTALCTRHKTTKMSWLLYSITSKNWDTKRPAPCGCGPLMHQENQVRENREVISQVA